MGPGLRRDDDEEERRVTNEGIRAFLEKQKPVYIRR